jgi:hypothetical protein
MLGFDAFLSATLTNEVSMSRKHMLAILGLGLGLLSAPGISIAQESHLSQAISHAREAVSSGREGKPEALTLHATEALHHAEAEQKERPNHYVKSAIKRLKEAVKFGKAKRSSATKVVDRALQELERAPQ